LSPPSVAIILTHNRPELLQRCVSAIAPQVDQVLIIDNASDPPVNNGWPGRRRFPANTYIFNIPDQPPNLSKLWNNGLRWACDVVYRDDVEDAVWDVAVLCDDAIVPEGWFRIVADGMRAHNAAAASTHGITPIESPILKTAPDSDIRNRMCSWAFVTAGERNIQADERLRWWWGDTDFDWRARQAGGVVILPGPVVVNERPNDFLVNIPELGEQAGRDTEMFVAIHGGRPW
jgi:GT2 family glycosyltransferase